MDNRRARVRLRQAVIVATEFDPVAEALRSALGLGEPFRDPGVGMFGLQNAVFSIGDCFLEIVSPTQPGTAAGRYLERHDGDSGYMVMFDLEDLAGGRQRAKESGVRTVWEIDLPDISGTHLHPADIGGAIVSIDGSRRTGAGGGVDPSGPGRPARAVRRGVWPASRSRSRSRLRWQRAGRMYSAFRSQVERSTQ